MSQAICAGCLEPIPKSGTDSKFVLSGTEVFHSRCAHLIGRSVLTRYRVKINDLRAKLAAQAITQADVARLRRDLDESIVRYNVLHGQHQRVERDLESARANAQEQTATFLRMRELRDSWAADCNQARAELAEAKAELARIRGTPSNEGSTKDANFPDDLSIRAGLLEID